MKCTAILAALSIAAALFLPGAGPGSARAATSCLQVAPISCGVDHTLLLRDAATVYAAGDNGQTVVPANLSGVVAVAAGGYHSLALQRTGTVVAWGKDDYGQAEVPSALTGVIAVAAGWSHSLALKSDGGVVAWGDDSDGATEVPKGLKKAIAVAAGYGFSLALQEDGTVAAWGYNADGETAVPAGLAHVVAIAAGDGHALALKSDGTVAAWGINGDGQTNIPTGLAGVAAVAANGWHSLALKSDGTVVAWGYNADGQATVPDDLAQHQAGQSGVVAIAAGYSQSVALRDDGTVEIWGLHPVYRQSELSSVALPRLSCPTIAISASVSGGNGTISPGASTVAGGSGASFTVTPASGYDLLLPTDGSCPQGSYTAGSYAIPAPLYDCTVTASFIRIWPVAGSVSGSGGSIAPAAAQTVQNGSSASFTVAPSPGFALLKPIGGSCSAGSLNGDSYTTGPIVGNCTVIASFARTLSVVPSVAGAGGRITPGAAQAVLSGGRATLLLTPAAGYRVPASMGGSCPPGSFNGDSYTTGPIGADCTLTASFPPSARPNLAVRSISDGGFHSLAVKPDGGVVAWGTLPANASFGQTTVPAGLSNVVQVAAGAFHSLALNNDGSVVAWGDKSNGATDVPQGLKDVVSIAAGNGFSLALKSDGTVVAWGYDGDKETEVPTGLADVVAISAGYGHVLALKSDGTVAAWGLDYDGQTEVPAGLAGVVAVAAGAYHSLALKSDGSVIAWGYDGDGQTEVPGGLAGVTAISAGSYHSLALKSDATVVSWGDQTLAASPVFANVVAISAAEDDSLALKADGSIVEFYADAYGAIGLADTTGLKAALPTLKVGDCDGNGVVGLDEVRGAVDMFLGLKSVQACVDFNGDNAANSGEVQKTFNGFSGP